MSPISAATSRFKNSVSIKLIVIGLLLVILQIPQLFVQFLIDERQSMQYQAQRSINERWGGSQHVGPPLLITSQDVVKSSKNKETIQTINHQILPASFKVMAELDASTRYLGIYEVPVYVAEVMMEGQIEFDPLTFFGQGQNLKAESIFIPIKSMRGLKAVKSLQINNKAVNISQQQIQLNGQTGINVDLNELALVFNENKVNLNYSIELSVAGSKGFSVLPMAGQSDVEIKANWPSPSFNGDFLPDQRTITEQGFSANWHVNELNHNLGRVMSHSLSSNNRAVEHFSSYSESKSWPTLGMQILIPADNYQVIERTVKYSLLIMVLTFAGFFMAEMFFKLRLHPFQYLLIGFSLTAFYLLLLSFSEYMFFDWAFAIAALANISLISGYCSVVLKQRKRGILTGLLFTLLYGFIFILVKAEQSSLLMGAVGIWVFLALVMYLTRKIDWYDGV